MIRTHYDPKPIPSRDYDWTATTEDYDGSGPVGYGATEEGAIADLKEQLADRAACAEFARTVEIVTNRTGEYLRVHREIESESAEP